MALQGLQAQIQTHFAAFRNVADSVTGLSDSVVVEYQSASTSGSATLEIDIAASTENPIFLKDITHLVTQGFSDGTEIEVGDGSTGDKYLGTADISASTSGDTAMASRESKAFDGKLFLDSGRVVVTVAGGDGTGVGVVVLDLLRIKVPVHQGDSTEWAFVAP